MNNTSKKYFYSVKISLTEDNESANIGNRNAEYKGGGSSKDTIIFSVNEINIELYRSRKYEDGSILSNSNNSINVQIRKALLCYYGISARLPMIRNISICRREHNGLCYNYMECKSFIQPLNINQSSCPRSFVFTPSIVDLLLEESLKGKSFRIAMSYWLKGCVSNDEYFKFDRYWRAFNRLFMYQGGDAKEINCMIAMRNFILQNEIHFSRSISETNRYSKSQLHSFRWNKMILNDYDTRKKNKTLVDFVLRNHDRRIMELFKEKLVCRMQFLTDAGFDSIVNSHINQHSTTIQDGELVTLIAIKYAYYIRNKFFHGEFPDGTFKIKNDNIDQEIQRINILLEILVWELIENHSLFV